MISSDDFWNDLAVNELEEISGETHTDCYYRNTKGYAFIHVNVLQSAQHIKIIIVTRYGLENVEQWMSVNCYQWNNCQKSIKHKQSWQ